MADLHFRPGTWDRSIWQSVFDHDEYGLKALRLAAADLVLDVGAHIGAFTYTVLGRGAGHVVACEPDVQNFHLLQHNLHQVCEASDRALLLPCAAWRSDPAGRRPTVCYAGIGMNTGGGHTLGDGRPVAALALDDLIRLGLSWSGAASVRLLKLDCEGAEWPLLWTCKGLLAVDALVGEYHETAAAQGLGLPPEAPATADALCAWLTSQGFTAEHRATGGGLGLFRAWRPGMEPWA